MDTFQIILGILFVAVLVVGVFIIIRDVILWYYKINERIELMQSTLKEQKETNRLLKLIAKEPTEHTEQGQ